MESSGAFQSSTCWFQHFSSVQFKLIRFTHQSCCSWAKIKNLLVLHTVLKVVLCVFSSTWSRSCPTTELSEEQKAALWSSDWGLAHPTGSFSPVNIFYYARRAIPSRSAPIRAGWSKSKTLAPFKRSWTPAASLETLPVLVLRPREVKNSHCRGARSLQGFNIV